MRKRCVKTEGRSAADAKESLLRVSEPELSRRLARIPKRDQRLDMRVSAQEKAMIQKLAQHYGVSVTDLLLTLAELANEELERSQRGRAGD